MRGFDESKVRRDQGGRFADQTHTESDIALFNSDPASKTELVSLSLAAGNEAVTLRELTAHYGAKEALKQLGGARESKTIAADLDYVGADQEDFAKRVDAIRSNLAEVQNAGHIKANLAWMEQTGVEVVGRDDPEYPQVLVDRMGGDAPVALFMQGNIPHQWPENSIYLTGLRAPTKQGEHVAGIFGANLTKNGYTLISSGDLGVDVAALRGALKTEAGGRADKNPLPTITVLPGGMGNVRPYGHDHLFELLSQRGTIMSEHAPSVKAGAEERLRNKQVCGALAGAMVVVQATPRSGAMRLAREELSQGRKVGITPPIFTDDGQEMSELNGTSRLLDEGAVVVDGVADIEKLLESNRG